MWHPHQIPSISSDKSPRHQATGNLSPGWADTDLERAVAMRNHDVTKRLLECGGIDVNHRNRDGYTAVETAVMNNDLPAVQLLLQNGGTISPRLRSILSGKWRTWYRQTLQALSLTAFSPRRSSYSPANNGLDGERLAKSLQVNVELGQYLPFRLLKIVGKQSQARDIGDQLLEAVSKSQYTMVELLVNEEVDLDVAVGLDGWAPLHEAVSRSDKRMVKLLLNGGANISFRAKNDATALDLALFQRDEHMTQILLNHGADVNAKASDGMTVLEKAVRKSSPIIVGLLVQHGANVNAKGKHGFTALEVAVILGQFETGEVLIANGADVNAANGAPLRDATWRRDLAMARLLLDKGADADAQGRKGHLALGTAVSNGDQELALLLLSKGADIGKPGKSGKSAAEVAIARGDIDMQHLLESGNLNSDKMVDLHSTSVSKCCIKGVTCTWEIPTVLRGKSERGKAIAGALALTSGTEQIEARQCEEYLRAKYGDQGITCLRAIMAALDSSDGTLYSDDISIIAKETEIVLLNARDNSMVDALFWMCLAFRNPIEGSVAVSSGYLDCGREKQFVLRPLSKAPRLDSSCWHSLFNSAVIAISPGSDMPKRHWLEVDFQTMVRLAAVEYTVRAGEGLVLLGYSTALIPIELQDNVTILWHLEICSHDEQFKITELEATQKNWLRTLDPQFFSGKRARIGWYSEVVTLLGTNRLPPTVSWSDARSKPTTWRWRGANLQFVAQCSGPLQIGAQAGATFELVTNSVRYNPASNYLNLLNNAAKQQVILYDTKTQRAWMVSLASVILHMVVIYQTRLDFTPLIPYAQVQSDGAQASLDALRSNGSLVVEEEADDRMTVRELIMGFSSNFAKMPLQAPSAREIYGYEFMDIVHSSPMSELKRMAIRKETAPWTDLLAYIPCLFCSDLGDAILGLRSTNCAAPCNALATGRNYLATTIRCIGCLASKAGDYGNSSSRAFPGGWVWNMSGNPFDYCGHNLDGAEDCWAESLFLQNICRKRLPESQSCRQVPRDGAIVFGRARSERRNGLRRGYTAFQPQNLSVSGGLVPGDYLSWLWRRT
ncbi:hypothetical protein BDW74DRAFT_143666 [Aspergillus multicolor]|uniref:uncharacterized protein n=1 Tax=Aspergillus multicolor TaxID=41759 RepID=UPI003CCDD249